MKVAKNFRLREDLAGHLADAARLSRRTETSIVEQALEEHLGVVEQASVLDAIPDAPPLAEPASARPPAKVRVSPKFVRDIRPIPKGGK